MRLKVLDIPSIVESRLCTGCGACASMAPDQLEMTDTLCEGRRPVLRDGVSAHDLPASAVAVCPGIALDREDHPIEDGIDHAMLPVWGPIRTLWEGHATDDTIRARGSSGGVSTALALFAIEKLGYAGALHIRARRDAPVFNETVLSTSREDLLEATGSRYAPASPCEKLALIEEQDSPSVFIGKPCDVAAINKARKLRPELDRKLGLTIAFFCAGTPTTRGTHELLSKMGIDDPASVRSFRYRGNGWPGDTTAIVETPAGTIEKKLSYEKSWGDVLTAHKQWRCNLCADHTGEFADISVADAWHRPTEGDAGRSIVIARTKRGEAFLRSAMDAGYVALEPCDPENLIIAQRSLAKARGQVWGRITALKLLGAPAPKYHGIPTFSIWLRHLTAPERVRSVIGTLRRYLRKGINRPAHITPLEHHPQGQIEEIQKYA